MSEIQTKKKRVENYPNFVKSVLVHTGPGLGLLRGQDVSRGKIIVLMEKSQNTYNHHHLLAHSEKK